MGRSEANSSLPLASSPELHNSMEYRADGISMEEAVCRCQRQQSSRSRRSVGNLNTTNFALLFILPIIFNLFFVTNVAGWPRRRSYTLYLPADYDLDVNQWALAAQPGVSPEEDEAPAEAPVSDAYYDLPLLNQDAYDDSLYEAPEETYPMSYFGPIMDAEPEEELELEELKHQKPFTYEKRRPSTGMEQPSSSSSVTSSTHPPSTEATPTPSLSTSAPVVIVTRKHPVVQKGVGVPSGQKEIAMLRPPSAKSHRITISEPEEPKISVAQRSPSNEKPSAYDRLRKYLSLDDALKKEYQQRRANAMNRHTKRESGPKIITDSDSLTGQLNNLKKKID